MSEVDQIITAALTYKIKHLDNENKALNTDNNKLLITNIELHAELTRLQTIINGFTKEIPNTTLNIPQVSALALTHILTPVPALAPAPTPAPAPVPALAPVLAPVHMLTMHNNVHDNVREDVEYNQNHEKRISNINKRKNNDFDDQGQNYHDNYSNKSSKLNETLKIQQNKEDREQRNRDRERYHDRAQFNSQQITRYNRRDDQKYNSYKKSQDYYYKDTQKPIKPKKLKFTQCCIFEFNKKGSCIKEKNCSYCHNVNQLIICPYGIDCLHKYTCQYNIHCEYERTRDFIEHSAKFKATQSIMLHNIRDK
jgi:hypothetical protein